jgi:hypothetical protein
LLKFIPLNLQAKDLDCSRRDELWRETKHQIQQVILQLALRRLEALPDDPKPASPSSLTFRTTPTLYSDDEDEEQQPSPFAQHIES